MTDFSSSPTSGAKWEISMWFVPWLRIFTRIFNENINLWAYVVGHRANSNQARICVLGFTAHRVWLVSRFYMFILLHYYKAWEFSIPMINTMWFCVWPEGQSFMGGGELSCGRTIILVSLKNLNSVLILKIRWRSPSIMT